jgi:hypothetical protein
MNSSASSNRKLLPFVPDVPYHVQLVFILCFGYIWKSAFEDDYMSPMPEDITERDAVIRDNWMRSMIGCVVFLCSYSYLRPMSLDFFHPMQRFWRVMHSLSLIYFCFVICMLNHRPGYGRGLLGYFDKSLNQEVTKGHHTYDDNCDFTW